MKDVVMNVFSPKEWLTVECTVDYEMAGWRRKALYVGGIEDLIQVPY